MESKFNQIYNKLIIEQANDNNQIVDPNTIDDQRVKKLLKYKVDLSGHKNNSNKKLKTDLNRFNIIINGLNYIAIYDSIQLFDRFGKVYPGADKTTCKCWHVSNSSKISKYYAQHQHSPGWINSITSFINDFVEFEQTFDKTIDKCVETKNNGHHTEFDATNKKDLKATSMSSTFIIFYVNNSNTILKPSAIDDTTYKKMCEILANISIAMRAHKFNTQGLENLTNEAGESLNSIGKKLIQNRAKAQAEKNASLKSKFKVFLKKSFGLYCKACKDTFQDFIVTVQSEPWGKDTLEKIIKYGNEQVAKGEADTHFIDINFAFGHPTNTDKSEYKILD